MSRQNFALEDAVPQPNGCIVWTRSVDAAGYGRIGVRYVHREAYEAHIGPIPDGLHIDHLCRNRACCNPEHLEAVTQGENTRRGWEARQTHRCHQGHDLSDPDNVYRRKNGGRLCRPCALARAAKRSGAA